MSHAWKSIGSLALVAAALAVALVAGAASAEEAFEDRLTVKGDTLRGRLVRLTPRGVGFRTVYGDGDITVPYEHVEALETQGSYRFVFGEGEETTGRVLGIEDGEVLVGDEADSALYVSAESIRGMALQEEFEENFMTRMRARFPHWTTEFDLGFEIEDGAIEKQKVRTRLILDRRLQPTRFTVDLDFAFDSQKKRNNDTVTTKNEFFSTIRYDHDLPWERFFALGLAGYEFDRPRQVNARTFPTVGMGYRFLDGERSFFNALAGFGWVYEDFDGSSGSNNWASWMVGLEGEWALPRDSTLRASAIYIPRLSDPGENWLFRWNMELTVPIWDPISMKFRIVNITDNNPAKNVGNNKFVTNVGFSVKF